MKSLMLSKIKKYICLNKTPNAILQPLNELEQWNAKPDPWNYETNPDDTKRKEILLREIPDRNYKNVLDIGCGQGFITRELPGDKITGVDISSEAIKHAQQHKSDRIVYEQCSVFDLNKDSEKKYDLIIITGVLYPQYIGDALNLIYIIVEKLLAESGILISVHIDSWYKAKFPYLLLKEFHYTYRDYIHRMEVYVK